ncbi:MAG TPA: hypothetical protein VKD08_03225, partial [Ignavibacteriaceae bacterium]|nr:hypothetical protein [Ignavibacteriaceae bacterium]
SEAGGKNEEDGDNLNHTAEKDSSKPVFKTNAGRIVYGGGGITPDYIVKSDDATGYTTELLKNNAFYEYALKYLENHGKMIQGKYNDSLSLFLNGFSFSKSDINNFIKFTESKDIKFNEDDFKKDHNYIETRLTAEIARNYWKDKGWYSVLLKSDNQMLKAVSLFDEAKDLAKLK